MDAPATNDRPTSAVVPLLFPVKHAGATYDQLVFRRMRARDALAGEDEADQTMAGYKLFATLANVPLDVILDLDMEDLAEVGAAVAPLMGKRAVEAMKTLLDPAAPSPGET